MADDKKTPGFDPKRLSETSNDRSPDSASDSAYILPPDGTQSDDTQPGDTAAGNPSEQDALKQELAKAKSDYLYLYAEFENYKKNAIKERSEARKYSAERLVVDILNVIDIFETALAIDPTPETLDTFKKGMQMTALELRQALLRHGVEELPAIGVQFNPVHHEALSSEETGDHPPGHIARVFKKPYKLHDRVVRPGQVVVAKPKPE